ncbi:MAG: Plug domain-containing protein, partial [Candidatus Electrothrix sp. AR1]|nr:Plug domain-containing protein [Candidatus Electrothrix sp. AR1]
MVVPSTTTPSYLVVTTLLALFPSSFFLPPRTGDRTTGCIKKNTLIDQGTMHKHYVKEILFTLAAFAAASPGAAADNAEIRASSEEQQDSRQPASTIMTMGEIVVTGEQDNPAVDLPGSVDVVSEEEIARQNNKTALDALRNVPGIKSGLVVLSGDFFFTYHVK